MPTRLKERDHDAGERGGPPKTQDLGEARFPLC